MFVCHLNIILITYELGYPRLRLDGIIVANLIHLLKTLTMKSSPVILLILSATAFMLNWVTWIFMNLCLNITSPLHRFMTTTLHPPCAIWVNDELCAKKAQEALP